MNRRTQALFAFAGALTLLAFLLTLFANNPSAFVTMGRNISLFALLALAGFAYAHHRIFPEQTGARKVLMEDPLFNPKASPSVKSDLAPLEPKFIALYLEEEDKTMKEGKLLSIQALRYEKGYYSQGLFLPLAQTTEDETKSFYSLETALEELKKFVAQDPVVLHGPTNLRGRNVTWNQNQGQNMDGIKDLELMLKNAINTEDLAKVLYPTAKEVHVEALYEFLHFEINPQDPYYGAHIAGAVYLDYLNSQGYYTSPKRMDLTQVAAPKAIPKDQKIDIPSEKEAVTTASNHQVQDSSLISPSNLTSTKSLEETPDEGMYKETDKKTYRVTTLDHNYTPLEEVAKTEQTEQTQTFAIKEEQ